METKKNRSHNGNGVGSSSTAHTRNMFINLICFVAKWAPRRKPHVCVCVCVWRREHSTAYRTANRFLSDVAIVYANAERDRPIRKWPNYDNGSHSANTHTHTPTKGYLLINSYAKNIKYFFFFLFSFHHLLFRFVFSVLYGVDTINDIDAFRMCARFYLFIHFFLSLSSDLVFRVRTQFNRK